MPDLKRAQRNRAVKRATARSITRLEWKIAWHNIRKDMRDPLSSAFRMDPLAVWEVSRSAVAYSLALDHLRVREESRIFATK